MRSVSSTLRIAVSRQQTEQVFLVLLTFDHPDRIPDLTDTDLRGAWLNSEVAKTPNDYSSAADHMTAAGSPSYPAEGVTLGGAADYLSRAEALWRPDQSGTVMGWINRAAAGAAHCLFASCDEVGATKYFEIFIAADNLLHVRHADGGAVSEYKGSTTLTADTDYHIAVVSDGDDWAFYIDGEAETLVFVSGTAGGWLGDVSDRDNVTIGAMKRDAVSNYCNGVMRDWRYFSRPLGSVEIDKLYKAGLTTPVRVVNNNEQTHSAGKLYLPFPFEIKMPDEREDRVTSVTLRIDNVDRQIVTAIRQLSSAPTVSLSVVLASSPDTIEAGPFQFTLRKAVYNAVSVSALLEYEDVLREPIPGDAFTPQNCPGMFAGVS